MDDLFGPYQRTRLRDAGLGAIVVERDGQAWQSHDADPGWTLHIDPWEAARAINSRRTADELRAIPAEGGGDAYFAVIAGHLPLPEQSLGE